MTRLLYLALLVASAVPATIAHAEDDFEACDGYAAPKGKSDGISKAIWLWGLASRTSDIRRDKTPWLGESGLEACERALRDPALKDEFWLRRANLLQGEALHALGSNLPEKALELVDRSDQAGAASKDPYFARSVGSGNMAVRAYALIALGRKDEARRMIDALSAGRRWSQSIQRLSLMLQAQLDPAPEADLARLRTAVPLNPKIAKDLFWTEFLDGDYRAAWAIASAVDFSPPNMRGAWRLSEPDTEAKLIEERSMFLGAVAYTQAVLGQADAGRARISNALTALAPFLQPPSPRADGKPPRKSDVALYDQRRPYVERASAALQQWRKAIDFREKMKGKAAQVLESEMAADRLNDLPILPDVLSRLAEDHPELKPEIDNSLASLRSAVQEERRKVMALDATKLVEMLPKPETAGAVPVLKPAGDGYFLTDSGLSREQEESPNVWTIRYTHNVAPIAADEELAILGAAETARKLGYDSFIVLSADSIIRTTHVSGMYVGTYDANSGYEAQVRVRLVNASELSGDTQAMAWRALSAKQVIDELESRYRMSSGPTIAF